METTWKKDELQRIDENPRSPVVKWEGAESYKNWKWINSVLYLDDYERDALNKEKSGEESMVF